MSSALGFIVLSQHAALAMFWHSDQPAHGKPFKRWEEQIIKHCFLKQGPLACQQKLPHRSLNSIRHRARQLGLKFRERKLWSEDELRIVMDAMDAGKKLAQISAELKLSGYERTTVAVRDCAAQLREIAT